MASNAQSALNLVMYQESPVTRGLKMAWHREQQHLTSSEYLRPSNVNYGFILQETWDKYLHLDVIQFVCIIKEQVNKLWALSMGEMCVCVQDTRSEDGGAQSGGWTLSSVKASPRLTVIPSSLHSHLPLTSSVTSDDINEGLSVIESVARDQTISIIVTAPSWPGWGSSLLVTSGDLQWPQFMRRQSLGRGLGGQAGLLPVCRSH